MARAGLSRPVTAWLVLIHRWIGIAACLLFLLWFVSGMVMTVVRFPDLGPAETIAGLPAIGWTKVRIGPAEAERIASPDGPARAEQRERREAWQQS